MSRYESPAVSSSSFFKKRVKDTNDSESFSDEECDQTLSAEPGDLARPSTSKETMIIYFDLEISDLSMSCDILQIAMKPSGGNGFNKYLISHQSIYWRASEVHGLTEENGKLYLRDEPVIAVSKEEALNQLLKFLEKFEKPVTLVAHNCSFDAARLVKLIDETMPVPQFKNVISGFTEKLKLFRKMFPDEKFKGQCTLKALFKETFGHCLEEVHDAYNDICSLEDLTERHLEIEELIACKKSFDEIRQKYIAM